jgi:hypothetical protein
MEMIKALLDTNLQFTQMRDLACEAQKKLEKDEEAQNNQTNDLGSMNANIKQVCGISPGTKDSMVVALLSDTTAVHVTDHQPDSRTASS